MLGNQEVENWISHSPSHPELHPAARIGRLQDRRAFVATSAGRAGIADRGWNGTDHEADHRPPTPWACSGTIEGGHLPAAPERVRGKPS